MLILVARVLVLLLSTEFALSQQPDSSCAASSPLPHTQSLSSMSAASAASSPAGVTLVAAKSLHVSKPTHWLESRFHFNFAGFSGGKEQFGPLRVLNDDLVKAKQGFGRHPHRNAEIFSYVVQVCSRSRIETLAG